jgi:3-hydroxyisobutyrate dehydrogenase-like beta-hydroxyacid dehydrogenase
MARIALYGLGSMGFGMAESLVRAGHVVHGYDVNQNAVRRFRGAGGAEGEPADILPHIDILITAVVNAAQTQAVLLGDGAAASLMKKGAVVVSCATVPPAFAIALENQLANLGLLYVDAPMSGGAAKAATGELTFMASGTPAAFAAANPALDAMAATVFRLGDRAGPGSAMKVVNQMLAGVHIAAMGEAITFAMTQGVSPQQFMDVIPKCAGTSWMLENRGPHIADGDYTPRSAVEIFVKDLGIVGDIAREARFAAPLTATALQQFVAAAGMGYGREDDAAVAKVYARHARLSLPGEA